VCSVCFGGPYESSVLGPAGREVLGGVLRSVSRVLHTAPGPVELRFDTSAVG